jgi:choline dehydrogenase-like flavoprotein
MSSARLGVDPQTSVANTVGELHDAPGVWIGDASGMPTCSGANPMLTVMALAHRTATNMLSKTRDHAESSV